MDKYIVKLLVNNKKTERIVEAPNYSNEDIEKILTEIHPEWKVVKILPYEEKKEAV